MEQYLCIGATFLAERYHGHEWPPAPARLFQALVAGSNTGLYRRDWNEVQSVLKQIEELPAPEIVARNSRRSNAYRTAVPNNDSDKSAREWFAGRPFNMADIKTMKVFAPQLFEAAREHKHHVYYLWQIKGSGPAPDSVRKLTSFLHTFGWGIDMAYADSSVVDEKQKHELSSQAGYAHYSPGSAGKLTNIPVSGYLQDLSNAYKQQCSRVSSAGIDPSIRATRYGQVRYRRAGAAELATAVFLLRKLEDENEFFVVPYQLAVKVAAWMRHAVAEALKQERFPEDFVNSYVLGHGNGHGRHMSFVPLPSIGTLHTNGSVRRVMLVEPAGEDGSITELLRTKLASTEVLGLVNGGPAQPVCVLAEPPRDDRVLQFYLKTATVWESVTPVVLHGFNSEHGKFSLKKTEQLLYQAFEKSEYTRQQIAELYFQPAPFWAGTEGALQMRVPQHLSKWPRYHVSVRFKEPVAGPVLVGIGRHYGIGLFAGRS